MCMFLGVSNGEELDTIIVNGNESLEWIFFYTVFINFIYDIFYTPLAKNLYSSEILLLC